MSPRNERIDEEEEDGGALKNAAAGRKNKNRAAAVLLDDDDVDADEEPFVDEEAAEQEEEHDGGGNDDEVHDEAEEEDDEEQRLKRARKEEKRMYKTDEGRRMLRAEQRTLKEHIMASSTAAELHKYRTMNNKIFKHVHNAREAVFDAENNLLLATKLVHNAERLVQVPSFDPKKLVQKLKGRLRHHRGGIDGNDDDEEDGGGSGVAWRELGRSVGVCFNSVPERVTFMAGPLDAELPDKKRMQAERKKREPAAKVAEVELKQVKDRDGDEDDDEDGNGEGKLGKADRLSAGEKNRKLLKAVLKRKYDDLDEGSPGVPFLHLVLNPHSFTQSVENLFNFSSLLKKGEASITVLDKPGLGQTRGAFASIVSNQNDMAARQSVVGFDLRDWYRLCQAAGIEEGYLPHRPTKIAKPDNVEASQESTRA